MLFRSIIRIAIVIVFVLASRIIIIIRLFNVIWIVTVVGLSVCST